MEKMIYLACPYSHEDSKVRARRFTLANVMAAKLMEQGYVVFSPLSHSVPIEPFTGRKPHDFWMHQDLPWLAFCDELHLLMLDGWAQSSGIAREVEEAVSLKMPIVFHDEKEAL